MRTRYWIFADSVVFSSVGVESVPVIKVTIEMRHLAVEAMEMVSSAIPEGAVNVQRVIYVGRVGPRSNCPHKSLVSGTLLMRQPQ